MKKKPYFAVVYMFIVTAFFSSILILFARATRGRVDANELLAFERAVLAVFPDTAKVDAKEIHAVFTEKFVETKELGAWLYYRNHELAGYAVPVEGKGFWASIKGIVGVDLDGQTITGLSFYEQSETPGLGARIIEPDFRDQFIGKKIQQGETPIGIKPASAELKNNQVHAITGATQTCVRLEKLMNDGLSQWQQSMIDGGQLK